MPPEGRRGIWKRASKYWRPICAVPNIPCNSKKVDCASPGTIIYTVDLAICAQKLKPFGLIDLFTLSFYSSRRLLASRHEISVPASRYATFLWGTTHALGADAHTTSIR